MLASGQPPREGHHVGVVGHGEVVLEVVEIVEEAVRQGDPDRAVGVAAADPLAALDERERRVERGERSSSSASVETFANAAAPRRRPGSR